MTNTYYMGFFDIYEMGYTSYNCAFLAICPFLPKNVREAIYPVIKCTSWAVLTGFHCSWFMDKTVFKRLAEKYGLSLKAWNFSNILCHVVPTMIVTYYPPKSISNYHGIIAACMNYSWVATVTKGTYILDRIYVPFDPKHWFAMISVSMTTNLCVPWVCNNLPYFIYRCNQTVSKYFLLYRNNRLI